ncbi:hypothetical protein G7046_g7136 [Stylonectria norvegica]|nr:hypothetical protein G7046_g7136 [Stylonectria norvegica]
MASIIRKFFRRKAPPPLVCAVSLDESGHPIADDPSHTHTSACFIDFEPLAVVELFQSQACQSCPPAIPGIHDATSHPNLILLTYDITLFDHLGWKDTFASPAWDQRQRAYVMNWKRTSLFTPQIVVNGVTDGSAAGRAEVHETVGKARTIQRSMDWHIYVDANDTAIRIDSDKAETEVYDIFVVVYNGSDETVKVKGGPNKGKKINHRNVVVSVVKIGEWSGGNAEIPLASPESYKKPGQGAVVLVQQGGAGGGGPIIAAAKIS